MPVKESQMFRGKGFYNTYTGTRKGPGEIGINPDATQVINDRRLAYIHELMHAQDQQSFGSRGDLGSKEWAIGKNVSDIGEFLQSVNQTATNQKNIGLMQPGNSDQTREYGRYLSSPQEVIARAMTQHAVDKLPESKYSDLKDAVKAARNQPWVHKPWWTDKEMKEVVSPAVEKLIAAKGLKPESSEGQQTVPEAQTSAKTWQDLSSEKRAELARIIGSRILGD